jgi:hypothetical protein
MIIDQQSPFRQLPARLNREQILFFDGIRYSIEISDQAHIRLQQALHTLSVEAQPSENESGSFVSAFQDAWIIVDSVYRLQRLLRHMPGFKQSTPRFRLFLERTKGIEPLRNFVQHLSTGINAFLDKNLPLWGTLSWFSVREDGSGGLSCVLVPGAIFASAGHPIVDPRQRSVKHPVDLITLTVGADRVCLSDIMAEVTELARSFESQLKNQFVGEPTLGADLRVCVEVKFQGGPVKSTESRQRGRED